MTFHGLHNPHILRIFSTIPFWPMFSIDFIRCLLLAAAVASASNSWLWVSLVSWSAVLLCFVAAAHGVIITLVFFLLSYSMTKNRPLNFCMTIRLVCEAAALYCIQLVIWLRLQFADELPLFICSDYVERDILVLGISEHRNWQIQDIRLDYF